jgi:hypothetical protein
LCLQQLAGRQTYSQTGTCAMYAGMQQACGPAMHLLACQNPISLHGKFDVSYRPLLPTLLHHTAAPHRMFTIPSLRAKDCLPRYVLTQPCIQRLNHKHRCRFMSSCRVGAGRWRGPLLLLTGWGAHITLSHLLLRIHCSAFTLAS